MKKLNLTIVLILVSCLLTGCVIADQVVSENNDTFINDFVSSDGLVIFSYLNNSGYTLKEEGSSIDLCTDIMNDCISIQIWKNLGDQSVDEYINNYNGEILDRKESSLNSFKIIEFNEPPFDEFKIYNKIIVDENYFLSIFYNEKAINDSFEKTIYSIINSLKIDNSIINGFSVYENLEIGIKIKYPNYLKIQKDSQLLFFYDPYLGYDSNNYLGFEKRYNDREFTTVEYVEDWYDCEVEFVKNIGEYEVYESGEIITNIASGISTVQKYYFYVKEKYFIFVDTSRVQKDYFKYLNKDFQDMINSIVIVDHQPVLINSENTSEEGDRVTYQNNIFNFSFDKDLFSGKISAKLSIYSPINITENIRVEEYCESDDLELTQKFIDQLNNSKKVDEIIFNYSDYANLKLIVTENNYNLSQEEIENRLSLCAVGGIYPISSNNNFIIWVGSCSGGRVIKSEESNIEICWNLIEQIRNSIKFL